MDSFVLVDLSPYWNNDGISWEMNRTDGDLDGAGMTFPAEALPAAMKTTELCGVTMLFPDTTDGALNNVSMAGQQIGVPRGQYCLIHVLGVSEGGSFREDVVLEYKDGSTDGETLGLTDCRPHWGKLKFDEQAAIRFDEMHFPPGDPHRNRAPGICGMWLQTLKVDARKELFAVQLPDNPAMHVFAMTLQRT